MTNNELKRLSRRELVDVIYQLKRNEEELQTKIVALETELQDKRIRIAEAGTVAQAAVDISGVLTAAQSAADLYLQEIESLRQDTEKACIEKVEETNRKVQAILAEGKKQYDDLVARYEADYQKWQQLQADMQQAQSAD